MHTRKLRHEITIHALTSKVWKVLTLPEYTCQFMFNPELVSDWKKDSPILIESEKCGNEEVSLHKGKIEEVVPGILLRYQLFEMDTYSREPVIIQYELFPEEGGIKLIVTQEVLFHSPELVQLVTENSKMMMQKIKWLAEYA